MLRANHIFEDVSNSDLIEYSLYIMEFFKWFSINATLRLNRYDISFPKTNNRNIISHYYFEIQESLLQHQ